MRVWRWLMIAASFLTVLPWPVRGEVQPADVRASTVFYPLVGAFIGAVGCAVVWVLHGVGHVPDGAAAGVALAVTTALTGALHIDGWMDMADGLASRKPPEAALAVMRDSRVGAVGAAAGVLLLLGKWSAVTAVTDAPTPCWPWRALAVCAVPAAGRWAMVLSMRLAPYARSGGLGAAFAGAVPRWCLAGAGIPAVLLAWAVRMAGAEHRVPAVVFAIGLAAGTIIVTLVFTAWMRRRFGGMTGDLYGALNETVEWLGWVLLSACAEQGGSGA